LRRLNRFTKKSLDRKTGGLYYTNTVGNKNLDMKKPVAITLAFIFGFTVLLSGAFGSSDCATQCAREMAKANHHALMPSASLVATNCCSVVMKNSCEMAQVLEIKIPECSMTGHHTVSANLISIGFLTDGTNNNIFRSTQSYRRFIAGEINSKLPIYLKTLSILS
jgi:hypothetical protein